MARHLQTHARPRPDLAVDTDSKLVKSASRVFEILEYLDDLQRESTVMEIAQTLSFPQSSTSALLRSLVAMGYLVYDPHRRTYLTSSRVALLGSWVGAPFFADGAVLSLMRTLHRQTRGMIVLGMHNGPNVQYIRVLAATDGTGLRAHLGTALPLANCAAGHAILATMTDVDATRIAMRFNAQLRNGASPVQISQVKDSMARVRRSGYAFLYDTMLQGSGLIAAALPPIEGQRQLVIGVGASTESLMRREQDIVATLLGGIRALAADGVGVADEPVLCGEERQLPSPIYA